MLSAAAIKAMKKDELVAVVERLQREQEMARQDVQRARTRQHLFHRVSWMMPFLSFCMHIQYRWAHCRN